jgi:hypothetical protein
MFMMKRIEKRRIRRVSFFYIGIFIPINPWRSV